MRATVLALTLVVAVSGRAAAADGADSASPFDARRTAIYGVLGLGTPVGLAGVEVEETILQMWSLSAGAGIGASGDPQGAAMIHWLAGGLRSKVTIGVGVSGGKYKWTQFCIDDCDNGPATKSGTVAWGNFEIGGEHRFWSGFALRYFGGYGRIIAGNLVCDPPATSCGPYYQNDGYDLVYTGIGLGYSF